MRQIFAFAFLIISCQREDVFSVENSRDKKGWNLVFEDEFEGDSLNRNIWETSY